MRSAEAFCCLACLSWMVCAHVMCTQVLFCIFDWHGLFVAQCALGSPNCTRVCVRTCCKMRMLIKTSETRQARRTRQDKQDNTIQVRQYKIIPSPARQADEPTQDKQDKQDQISKSSNTSKHDEHTSRQVQHTRQHNTSKTSISDKQDN